MNVNFGTLLLLRAFGMSGLSYFIWSSFDVLRNFDGIYNILARVAIFVSCVLIFRILVVTVKDYHYFKNKPLNDALKTILNNPLYKVKGRHE